LIEGISGVNINVVSKLAAGDDYLEIKGIVNIKEDAPTNLAHK